MSFVSSTNLKYEWKGLYYFFFFLHVSLIISWQLVNAFSNEIGWVNSGVWDRMKLIWPLIPRDVGRYQSWVALEPIGHCEEPSGLWDHEQNAPFFTPVSLPAKVRYLCLANKPHQFVVKTKGCNRDIHISEECMVLGKYLSIFQMSLLDISMD